MSISQVKTIKKDKKPQVQKKSTINSNEEDLTIMSLSKQQDSIETADLRIIDLKTHTG